MKVKELLSICDNKFNYVRFDRNESDEVFEFNDLTDKEMKTEFKTFEVDKSNSEILFNI